MTYTAPKNWRERARRNSSDRAQLIAEVIALGKAQRTEQASCSAFSRRATASASAPIPRRYSRSDG
jgi:hypothetical protein